MEKIREAYAAGQREFGENFVQEGVEKIAPDRGDELDLVSEVVRQVVEGDPDREVFLVPLAIFWRKGMCRNV